MTHPPTGTLTFLFTDIEGSTARWEHFREAMSEALARHDAILRAAIEGRGGQVVKTVGDGFCAAFGDAEAALMAALDAQRALAGEDWSAFGPDFAQLRVRMGIHSGLAQARDGDYYGPALNRTARLMSAGHGGQVLLSLAVQQVLRDYLPAGVELRDWGEHRLKDLRHSEHIFQIVVDDLADVVTPLVTAESLTARDRVQVVEDAPARPLPEALAALLAAVRSEDNAGTTVALSPEQAREIAQRRPADLTAYRLGRIAEWSQSRYRLDGRFVGLTLLVDQGEEATSGRWAAKQERYEDLGALVAAVPEPAIVVLGPPGGGKSTLLRRLELDRAIAALRGEDDADTVTCFIQLNQFKAERPGDPTPAPGDWLAARWAAAYPDLGPLDDLLATGRVVLLLDAFNEMPVASEREFRERVGWWKDWLLRLVRERPGNRVVFSCRTLDYSASLSTPALRVPQVQIEPLSDEQIRDFLRLHSPMHGEDIWQAIARTAQLEALRAPYFLSLLVEQVEATGDLAEDRAGLFTGFVRQALRREVERDNPLFALEELLAERDLRRITQWQWRDAYELPERGALLTKLSQLAYGMQSTERDGEQSQVRVDYDRALELVDDAQDEAILKAGLAISVLDEDPAADEVLYRHQLLQEYFAARVLARAPKPELVAAPWRAAEISPTVPELLASLPPAETLPPLPQTGWEETTVLAAAMAAQPEPFLRAVLAQNAVVAGRAAKLPRLQARLGPAFLEELRWALAAGSRDPAADLRHRIACAYAVGDLGDPRWERCAGPHGDYLRPPMVAIPGGDYPIGDDDPIPWSGGSSSAHRPRHRVEIAPFRIGQYMVTNAEYACFLAADGYEDERWWDTAAGRDWRRGLGTAAGTHRNVRYWLAKYQAQPDLVDRNKADGLWEDEVYERWQRRLVMSPAEFDAHLHALYPEQRFTEPRCWRDERFNRPAQPVVALCWFEARAYCAWLSAQTDEAYHLPTEAAWEAAARGRTARAFAYGDAFDGLKANTLETRLRRPAPVGVFVDGDTPEGASDLTGNVAEWTSSLFVTDGDPPAFTYPYRSDDGRENAEAGADHQRVLRGGSWDGDRSIARAAYRGPSLPAGWYSNSGFRLAQDLS